MERCASHRSQLQQLWDQVRMQTPMPTSIYHPPSHNLKRSQFLFVRRDAHRTPFQCPYEGPFKVMQAGDKIFTIDRGGQKEFISVDRLKPAFVDLEHPVVVSEPKNRGSPSNKGHPLVPTQPQEWIEIPDLCHPSTPDQVVKFIYKDLTSRFWGEWCRRPTIG